MMSRKQVTHPVNVTYLVIGLVFLAVSGSWALRTGGVVNARQFGWVLPLMLVAIGAVGLLASTAKGIRRRDPDDTLAAERSDEADPIPTYSFGVDALEEKLEQAARDSAGGTTSSTGSDHRQSDQPEQ
jgi:hypothetical protein